MSDVSSGITVTSQIKQSLPEKKNSLIKVGLTNHGNTCYLNSVLQALYCCDDFRREIHCLLKVTKILNDKIEIPDKEYKTAIYINSLHVLFDGMDYHSTEGLSTFLYECRQMKKDFNVNEQQDAQEFLGFILENVDDLRKYLLKVKPQLTFPPSAFDGKISRSIFCCACNGIKNSEEPMNIVTMPLETDEKSNKASRYGSWSMFRWATMDSLVGENKYMCSRCKSNQDAYIFPWINQRPNNLIIHLCRFTTEMKSSGRIKSSKIITRFPTPLFITTYSYCFDGRVENLYDKQRRQLNHENPDTIRVQYKDRKLLDKVYGGYYLYAMIIHVGKSLHSGHYITVKQCPKKASRWYMFDDLNIHEIDILELYENPNYSPYILFYKLNE
uniref:Ubiquitin carboxyl-terminal hydrolase n=1 Tax=Rhabditophanes sp. KR3021 TaxID=114890 RepID=A0AC35TRV2_9BILA